MYYCHEEWVRLLKSSLHSLHWIHHHFLTSFCWFNYHFQISRNKEEKKSLALTGYKEGVHEAEARLKQLQDRFEEYKNRMKEHEERVATLESELTKTDERIHQLKPNLRLDSLEERCESIYYCAMKSHVPYLYLLHAWWKIRKEGKGSILFLSKTILMQPRFVLMGVTKHETDDHTTITLVVIDHFSSACILTWVKRLWISSGHVHVQNEHTGLLALLGHSAVSG